MAFWPAVFVKRKKPKMEKIPLVSEKPRYEKRVERVKQATPPRRVITPKREKVVVQKAPPTPEKHYLPERRNVVYGEKHERFVYGEPKSYATGDRFLGESHILDVKPGKIYQSPDRMSTERYTYVEPVEARREAKVVRVEPRVVQGDSQIIRQGEVTRQVIGEPRVIQGETRVIGGDSQVIRQGEVTRTVVGGNTSNVYTGERVVMSSPTNYVVNDGTTRVVSGGNIVGNTYQGTTVGNTVGQTIVGNTYQGNTVSYGNTVGNLYQGNTVSYGNQMNVVGGQMVNRY